MLHLPFYPVESRQVVVYPQLVDTWCNAITSCVNKTGHLTIKKLENLLILKNANGDSL